jgi:hypothetical protein
MQRLRKMGHAHLPGVVMRRYCVTMIAAVSFGWSVQ